MELTHSLPLVLLSVAISLVASYSALVLAGRVTATHGKARRRWLLGGGAALGTGIWSMHFVAMLAAHLPVPIAHDVSDVFFSLTVAIGASMLALYVASRPRLSPPWFLAAGVSLGGGIAGMHYIGMAGLVTAARVQYDVARVALSVLIAVGASLAALWLTFHLRERAAGPSAWHRALGTVMLGGAICGMHFTGMSAARFTRMESAAASEHDLIFGTTALGGAVAVGTCALLLLALSAARIDRRARTHATRILERITDGFLAFDPAGYCTYANRAAELLLRRPRQAMLGGTLHDLIPDAAGSALERACRRAMAEQVTVEVEELRPSLGLWLEVHVYPSANGLSVYFRDVTARQAADEALRRREHQLAEAQRIAQVGSWEWDVKTGEVAWSAETYRIFGLEPGSFTLTFDRFLAAIHPEHRESAAAAIGQAVEARGDFSFEKRILRPDGEVRVCHCRGGMVLDDAGAPVRFTGTCQDITERTEAEQRLRHATRMVDAVIHASPLAVIAADTDRRVTLWNPAAERIFGWSAQEVLGRVNPIVPAGQVSVLTQLLEAPEGGSGIPMVEAKRERRDGSQLDVSISAAPLYSPAGEVVGGVAILGDITAQRAAADALRTSEERFRELAENVHEVFWIMSPADGRLLYVSPAVEQVWNLTPTELVENPRRFYDSIHPDDRARVRATLSGLPQGDNEIEYRIVRPGGEVRWVRDRGFPVRDAGGTVVRVVGVAEDVTARKEAEETVRANERQAQKMAERMRAVAAAAAATLGAQSAGALRDVLADAARRVLPFDTFAVALLSADRGSLAYLGDLDSGAYAPPSVEPLPGTPGERVVRERRSLLTRRSGAPHGEAESGIRAPILSGGEVLGLLTVQSYTPDLYDEHDVEVLEALAALAATALLNITLLAEQNAVQEALRQSERDYRGLFENAHDAIIIMDPADERVLDVNPRACELYGFPRERFVGMSMEAVSLDVASGRDRVRETLQPGAPRQFELVQRAACGDDLHVEVTATAIPYRGGMAILSINRDITARKQAEEALRASELKFRSVTQSAADAIVTINSESRIVSWNGGAAAAFGYSEAEALGQPLSMVIPERSREQLPRGVARTARADHPVLQGTVLELVGARRDGTEFPLELSVALWEAGGRRFATGIMRDITERRQAEEALRRSQEQLAQAQKMEAVGRLAGGVAHDFNNLLTVIAGNASLAALDRRADVELCEHLDEIRNAAERAAKLTAQLLAYSRQQVLQPRLLDLDTVVSGMHKMLSRLIAEDVDVVQKLHGALPPVKADATQIEQVILNLAVNARDAMPDGGQMVIRTGLLELDSPRAHAGFELSAGSYVVLSVADTGCGMDADTLGRVFEPFFTTKPEGHGTGLGLATVYGIVTQTGGFIEAASEPGRGTRFDIFLPSVEAAHAGADPQASAPAPLARGSGIVLLVEDDQAVRLVGSRALARSGYTVLQAGDGEQGLAVAAAHPGTIDLVVTDVVMPRMGGRELVRRLAETRPNTRVIFTSGFTEDSVLRPETFEPGTHFLPKPFGPGELVGRVVEVLGQGWSGPPDA